MGDGWFGSGDGPGPTCGGVFLGGVMGLGLGAGEGDGGVILVGGVSFGVGVVVRGVCGRVGWPGDGVDVGGFSPPGCCSGGGIMIGGMGLEPGVWGLDVPGGPGFRGPWVTAF